MVLPFKSLIKLNRLVSNTGRYLVSRSITGAAVKEEVNYDLLHEYNKTIKEGGVVPVFRRALLFPNRIALHDEVGIYTYAGLYKAALLLSKKISSELLGETECTVPYLTGNEAAHVIAQWAIWMSGNIAVPLSPVHPPAALAHLAADSGARLLLATPELAAAARAAAPGVPALVVPHDAEIAAQLCQSSGDIPGGVEELPNSWYKDKDAMLIYTSGTTSKPKGAVWTHGMLQQQIASLHAAWQCAAGDVTLHTLPLHHIHGQLNSLNATLAAAGRVRMLRAFSPHAVWSRLLGVGEPAEQRPSVLHAVPAAYAALAGAHASMFPDARTRAYVRRRLERVRLMCAGSAPLPAALAARWHEITGHRLLERYGMSEAGMALSNPYRPADGRAPGRVGVPLPAVAAAVARPGPAGAAPRIMVTVETPPCETQICLRRLGVTSSEERDCLVEPGDFSWRPPLVTELEPAADGVYEGELLLRGPGVFTSYWNRTPELSSKDFTADGWFRTGDTASFAGGSFAILGRTSIDIIKTSGYKVSALQVEAAILEHDDVTDAAVLGVEHGARGETVAALVVVKPGAKVTLKGVQAVCAKLLAPYQMPRSLLVIDEMPRNAMGKLDKKVIRLKFAKELELKE